ncbi:glycosyltransferase [Saccharothrix obliqua]|uniref:glycosyltransferase n=1 Tax=Saccharothrix obliqua TaxID=2861747 RepID=UPI001C5E4E80|nr:glycosyltransferase [Saccharothrix obliqua]MBW4716212.1 glycosyltransferase [Saccharothrix obliqua]
MKVLFACLGAHGHTYPMLPLAAAVRRRGHEVAFATTTEFAPAVRRHGLRHVPAGIAPHAPLGDRPPAETPRDVITALFTSTLPRRNHADLSPFLRRWRPDLVVREVANLGAALAARQAGVPGVCHGYGGMWRDEDLPAGWEPTLALAAELGVDLPADDPLVHGDPYLDVCPPSLQNPGFLARHDVLPLRPVPFAEPGELPAWVGEHPLVYLTLGTAYGHAGVLRAAITGLAALTGVRVLVAAGPNVAVAELGAVPDHVTVLPWVPQAALLAHADLVVHHGGSGTTLGACGAGVPQLVLPQGADQFGNAAAVTARGLGDRLVGGDVTADAIADRARRLLADPAVRDAARVVAAEVAAMPSPDDVAALLPGLA